MHPSDGIDNLRRVVAGPLGCEAPELLDTIEKFAIWNEV